MSARRFRPTVLHDPHDRTRRTGPGGGKENEPRRGEPLTLRLVVVVALAATMATSCDQLMPITDPDQEVQYRSGTLTVPGAEIVVNGEVFDGIASIPSTTQIVGIVKGEEAYLWHPRIGDADLTLETSERALAYFVLGESGTLQASRVTAGPASTGLTVVTADPLSFRNDTKRWHAVTLGSESPDILGPGTSYDTGVSGGAFEAGLYGSVFWGMAIPVDGFAETLAKYAAAVADGARADVFARLGLIEFSELALEVTSLALGIKFQDCGQRILIGSLLTPFQQAFSTLASGEGNSTKGVLELVGAPLKGSASGFLQCVSDGIADQGAGHLVAKTLFKVASVVVDLFFRARFVADKVMAAHDVFRLDAYEVIRNESEGDESGGGDSELEMCLEGDVYHVGHSR